MKHPKSLITMMFRNGKIATVANKVVFKIACVYFMQGELFIKYVLKPAKNRMFDELKSLCRK